MYKWTLLFNHNEASSSVTQPVNTLPIPTDSGSNSGLGLSSRWIITIIVIVAGFVCLSIFIIYKAIQYRRKETNEKEKTETETETETIT